MTTASSPRPPRPDRSGTHREVDDRPPTAWARAYVRGMRARRDDEAFAGAAHTLRTALARQRDGDAPPTRWTRLRTRVTEEPDRHGLRTWTVRPRGLRRPVRPVARVVHLHGGGYVHPLTPDYWRLARAYAATPATVVVPAYPLAPAAHVDDVLPRLEALVVDLLDDDGPPVVLSGDSAGGALVLVVAQRLRDRGVDLSGLAGLVLLCPWLDATLAEDEVADLEATDPMLAESGLRAAGRWWAGRRSPADPRVSPLAGSVAGLPPVDLFIGDHDILRPAVDRLVEAFDRAATATPATPGATLVVHEVTAMFHVWMTRLLPEGARTRRALRALVRRRAGAAPGAVRRG